MKETILTKVDIKRIRKRLFRIVRKKNLGRDHYRSNSKHFRICTDIQPVHDVKALIPVRFATDNVVVVGGVANIVIWPPAGSDAVWEVLAIDANHDDVASRAAELFYHSGDGSVRLAHDNLVKNTQTLVYPIFHDESGLTHDHIIDIGPLQVSRVYDSRATIGIGGATNGMVLNINYAYRRVL